MLPHECTPPYILYLGDSTTLDEIKTATGLLKWRPEWCIGFVAEPECTVTHAMGNLPRISTVQEGVILGAKTFVICCVARGSKLSPAWYETVANWISSGSGIDVATGTHERIKSHPQYAKLAEASGCRLVDYRHHDTQYPLCRGEKRSGLRLLTIGHDGCVGKKYTSLALCAELKRRGVAHKFAPTGQTGALIAGAEDRSIVIDSTEADFASGAAAWLTPPAEDAGFWYVIEGQASLFHPGWAPPSLALLYGSQPDALVYCIDPTRRLQLGTALRVVPMAAEIDLNLQLARRVNRGVAPYAVSVNMANVPPEDYDLVMAGVRDEVSQLSYDVSVIDPNRLDTFYHLIERMVSRSVEVRTRAAEVPE